MSHYNTISDLLKQSLLLLMTSTEFDAFRLVGGTSLSLQLGHRISVDIDLFTDASYGSVEFEVLESCLRKAFSHVGHFSNMPAAIGKSYTIGININNIVKLDLFYTNPFIQPALLIDNVRMATVEEIIAMKIDIVQRGGRKKDFWDLHELLPKYSINKLLELHKLRYEYNHDRELILKNFVDFSKADEDFEPFCLRGKYWEFIREDLLEAIDDV